MIPALLKRSLDRYAEDHVPVGDFLTAVLRNNFVDAVCRADDDNVRILPEIARYVYNNLPSQCWGSRKKVEDWLLGTEK